MSPVERWDPFWPGFFYLTSTVLEIDGPLHFTKPGGSDLGNRVACVITWFPGHGSNLFSKTVLWWFSAGNKITCCSRSPGTWIHRQPKRQDAKTGDNLRDAKKHMPQQRIPYTWNDSEYGPACKKPRVIMIPGKVIVKIFQYFKRKCTWIKSPWSYCC